MSYVLQSKHTDGDGNSLYYNNANGYPDLTIMLSEANQFSSQEEAHAYANQDFDIVEYQDEYAQVQNLVATVCVPSNNISLATLQQTLSPARAKTLYQLLHQAYYGQTPYQKQQSDDKSGVTATQGEN